MRLLLLSCLRAQRGNGTTVDEIMVRHPYPCASWWAKGTAWASFIKAKVVSEASFVQGKEGAHLACINRKYHYIQKNYGGVS